MKLNDLDRKACARRLVTLLDAGELDRRRFHLIADMLYLDAIVDRHVVQFDEQNAGGPVITIVRAQQG